MRSGLHTFFKPRGPRIYPHVIHLYMIENSCAFISICASVILVQGNQNLTQFWQHMKKGMPPRWFQATSFPFFFLFRPSESVTTVLSGHGEERETKKLNKSKPSVYNANVSRQNWRHSFSKEHHKAVCRAGMDHVRAGNQCKCKIAERSRTQRLSKAPRATVNVGNTCCVS